MCVSVYETATHLFANKAQDGSVVMAPVLTNTTVGGNVTQNIGDNITYNITNINNMNTVDHQKKGENLIIWLVWMFSQVSITK